jgi:Skp family chaperone for outer membrane proteins
MGGRRSPQDQDGPRKTKPKQGVLSVRFFFPATLVALTTLVYVSSGNAQEGIRPSAGPVSRAAAPTSPPPNGTNVAVIDIAYIFKNHNRFNTQMKQLETEATEIQGWMKEREAALQAMKEGLKNFKVGTPDFQKAEEKFANEGTQYQLEVRRRQQDVNKREAAIYYTSYEELQKAVAQFALVNRIGIVLKFSKEEIKEDDRNSIMQGLARPVVYHDGLDISKFILTELNKGQPAPVTTPGSAGRSGPRIANPPPPKTGPKTR